MMRRIEEEQPKSAKSFKHGTQVDLDEESTGEEISINITMEE